MLKKLLICLLGLVLSFSLCACNSGGAQRGDNPVPDKAQSVVSKKPTLDTQSKDDSQLNQLVQTIIAKESEWTLSDKMSETGISGFYATGYMFFDIDLDGNKELLAQLGTTDRLACETVAFRFDEQGNMSQIKCADGVSYSAEGLSLWTDEEGNSFYLNHYVKSVEKGTQEVWSKIYYKNDTIKEDVCFYIDYPDQKVGSSLSSAPTSSNASNEEEKSETEFFIAGQQKSVSKEDFDKAFNEFRKDLEQTNIDTVKFIKSTDWALFTQLQKENALFTALK